jgi:hypothetical protein
MTYAATRGANSSRSSADKVDRRLHLAPASLAALIFSTGLTLTIGDLRLIFGRRLILRYRRRNGKR